MDYSLIGSAVSEEITKNANNLGCLYLRKGRMHKSCDDAALLVKEERYVLIGVFDGVSGEAFGADASEAALRSVAAFVKNNFGKTANEQLLEHALEEANYSVRRGATTASVALVLVDGSYFFANIGDSHIYLRHADGTVVRLTKDEKSGNGMSFTTYTATRHIVLQALGGLISSIDKGKGRVKSGDALIAVSDGIVDNLFIKVDGGVVVDNSGCDDLAEILKGKKGAEEIVEHLAKEIKERMKGGESMKEGLVLVPKDDDVAIVALKL